MVRQDDPALVRHLAAQIHGEQLSDTGHYSKTMPNIIDCPIQPARPWISN